MALNVHTVHKYAVHFLFTEIKWKTFGVFVRILYGAFGSTHKHFYAHSVRFVWSVLLQVNTQLNSNLTRTIHKL